MTKKLRIATMVSAHFTIPPPGGIVYAPMDIAKWVAEGLTVRGHTVDLFAPEGSSMKVRKVVSKGIKALKQNNAILKYPKVTNSEINKIFNLWDQYLIAEMFKAAKNGDYDLLHFHPIDRAMPLALSNPEVPVVYTLHDPIYEWRREVFKMFSSPNQHLISISNAQRKLAPELNYISTVYNGIDTGLFPFYKQSDDYFVFVGRLHPEKGVAEAVQVAKLARVKLIIVGPPVTGEYWDKKVKPYLNDEITYVGFVPYNELHKYYGKAKAILAPIQWEEPFGLVMVEAMACGTPVIAFERGSVPEVVVDGKTGFIVNTVEEMAEATKKVDKIDRHECHRHVEDNFSIKKMVDGYEQAFLKILKD